MRRTWIGIVASVTALVLLYATVFRKLLLTEKRPLLVKTKRSKLEKTPNYHKYLEINANILKRLKSLPSLTYKDSKTFIDYGEPISNILPPNYPKVKRILDYTGFWGSPRTVLQKHLVCGENIVCEGTTDKTKLLSSEAVVFHGPDVHGVETLPKQRLPHQRWVFFVMESPFLSGIEPSKYNGVFNYTSSYRLDSDVPVHYFYVYRRNKTLSDREYKGMFTDIMKTKTKLVAQMNSNCQSPNTKRLAYIRELRKHIHVDTYGKCGTLKCARYTKRCLEKMKSYKFYMSMANSHCRDYITEKPAEPLFLWRTVPVVMGLDNPKYYEKFLPPGSFIPTSGFESPQKLAEYLLLLDRNPDLYERFHDWRRNFTGALHNFEVFCGLCRKLHNVSAPVQTYTNFSGWYAQDTCKI